MNLQQRQKAAGSSKKQSMRYQWRAVAAMWATALAAFCTLLIPLFVWK